VAAQLEMYEGKVSRVSDRNAGGMMLDGYDGWFNVSQYAKPAPELPIVGDTVAIGCNNKGFVESVEILQEGPGPRRAAPRQQQQARQQAPGGGQGGQQRQQAPGSQQGNQRAATAPPGASPAPSSELPQAIRLRAMALELAVQFSGTRPNAASEHIVPLAKRFEHYLKTGETPTPSQQPATNGNGNGTARQQTQPEQPPAEAPAS
jgi:hypothetical protein